MVSVFGPASRPRGGPGSRLRRPAPAFASLESGFRIGAFQQGRALLSNKLLRCAIQFLDLAPSLRVTVAVLMVYRTCYSLTCRKTRLWPRHPAPTLHSSEALEQLTPRVYRELRRIAGHLLRNERPGYTLQSTDLVHEAYVRLIDAREVNWQHRAHFFAVAATLMRRILLDRALRRAAEKRGAKPQLVNLDAALDVCATGSSPFPYRATTSAFVPPVFAPSPPARSIPIGMGTRPRKTPAGSRAFVLLARCSGLRVGDAASCVDRLNGNRSSSTRKRRACRSTCRSRPLAWRCSMPA
jgi:ECF sigma factor